jgi:hypothetical protein
LEKCCDFSALRSLSLGLGKKVFWMSLRVISGIRQRKGTKAMVPSILKLKKVKMSPSNCGWNN